MDQDNLSMLLQHAQNEKRKRLSEIKPLIIEALSRKPCTLNNLFEMISHQDRYFIVSALTDHLKSERVIVSKQDGSTVYELNPAC